MNTHNPVPITQSPVRRPSRAGSSLSASLVATAVILGIGVTAFSTLPAATSTTMIFAMLADE